MMVHVSLCLLLFATCGGQNRCLRPVEVAFVVENTARIPEIHFQEILKFFQGVVDHFDDTRARFAAVTFGTGYKEEFTFKSFKHAAEVKDALGKIVKRVSQRADVPAGIKYARETFFKDPRPGSAKVLILLTGRMAKADTFLFDSTVEAHMARSKGILVIVIALGETINSEDEYIPLTSRPAKKYLIVVNGVSGLYDIKRRLVDTICDAPAMSPCESEVVEHEDKKGVDQLISENGECETAEQEVAFVIDKSNSIDTDDFKKQLEFINNLIDSFDISTDKIRVGAVSFSTRAVVEFYLQPLTIKQELMSRIASIRRTSRNTTAIGHGLQLVLESVFKNDYIRKRADKVVILVTGMPKNGNAQDVQFARKIATLLKEAHVHLYVVGIGQGVDVVELRALAAKPIENYLFLDRDVGFLNAIKERVRSRCL